MRFLILGLILSLSQTSFAVQGGHLKSSCVDVDRTTYYEYVDQFSLLLHTAKKSYVVALFTCEYLETASGIDFVTAKVGRVCKDDQIVVYDVTGEPIQTCGIVSIIKVSNKNL